MLTKPRINIENLRANVDAIVNLQKEFFESFGISLIMTRDIESLRRERDELLTWQNNARYAKAELDLDRIRLQDIIRELEAKLGKAKDGLMFYGGDDIIIVAPQIDELIGETTRHEIDSKPLGWRARTILEEIE